MLLPSPRVARSRQVWSRLGDLQGFVAVHRGPHTNDCLKLSMYSALLLIRKIVWCRLWGTNAKSRRLTRRRAVMTRMRASTELDGNALWNLDALFDGIQEWEIPASR